MDKKLTRILCTIFIILLVTNLSGCIKHDDSKDLDAIKIENNPTNILINGPNKAYFGDKINLNAQTSKDSEGTIIDYKWYFADGTVKDGKNIEHCFSLENNNEIEYPVIYPITLYAFDDSGSTIINTHQLKLYPKEFVFYFNEAELSTKLPTENFLEIKPSNNGEKIEYPVKNFINIAPCNWNASLFLSKSIFLFVSEIKIEIIDVNDKVVSTAIKDFKVLDIWKNKQIILESELNEEIKLKQINLEIYGLSLNQKVKLSYGRNNPSKLIFSFTDNLNN